jgi:tRNA (cmo5U34)-methyltransferase
VLTLQFTPIDYRQRILHDVFRHTVPGGALILVEKILGASTGLGAMMIDLYHAHKTGNGYSVEEVERKRLALEGVLVPVTARWNEELLSGAGFDEVDCFWRWMNFCGWVAVKGE